MNRQLRRLTVGLLVLFGLLFVQLNWLQTVQAGSLRKRPDNTREVIRDFTRARGTIYSADNQVLALSVQSDDRYELQRQYPLGELFSHPVGYFSLKYGTSEVESVFNDVLTGRTPQQELRGLGNLFSAKVKTGDVYLTLRADLQAVARDALGDKEGSVVLLDPKTGAIFAMWSNPGYDPNLLASHDLKQADDARATYLANKDQQPLLSRVYQERYMPGSTFKVLTTATALDAGVVDLGSKFPNERAWVPPLTTTPIQNYGGSLCGGDLKQVFTVSCNIPFAQTGLNVGAARMVEGIDRFGFQDPAPIDLPGAVGSYFGTPASFDQDDPKLAQSAFGQNEVQGTPLHMALVAAAVANEGKIMTPHVLDETRDAGGSVLTTYQPKVWKTAMSKGTAATLKDLMVSVVQNGTARCCMQLANGIQAAAKTGTAQLRGPGDPGGPSSHAWILGFAPADEPSVAFAVFVKATPEVTAGVGGSIAGPVAKQLVDAALALGA